MVALRGYDELPPPPDDGRLVRSDKPYGRDKVALWYRIASAASTAMKDKRWLAGRACVDMHAACGINRVEGSVEGSGKLRWGSALLSLQVPYRFDTYVFCEKRPKFAATLAERVADPAMFGYDVLGLDLGSETLGVDIQRIKGENPEVKVVVITGDANDAAPHLRQLLPGWPGRRYVLTLLDPQKADVRWDALDALTAQERTDVMFLFPEDMDIERNVRTEARKPPGESRFDDYFAAPNWRDVLLDPGTRDVGLALRSLYKRDMQRLLGYEHFGERDFRVRNSGGGQIYTLCFASKHERGKELWDRVNRNDPDDQLLFPI